MKETMIYVQSGWYDLSDLNDLIDKFNDELKENISDYEKETEERIEELQDKINDFESSVEEEDE